MSYRSYSVFRAVDVGQMMFSGRKGVKIHVHKVCIPFHLNILLLGHYSEKEFQKSKG